MARFSWIGCALLVVATCVSACAQTDAGVTTAVKSKFATDDVVKAYKIDVDTSERVVTLTGSVESDAARERAVQLARDTESVTSVVDNLVVAPVGTTGIGDRVGEGTSSAIDRAEGAVRDSATAVADAAITSAVKTKYLADSAVAGTKIDVDTANGVVTLTGRVKAEGDRLRAVTIARETSGVKSVVDNLTVGQ